MGYQFVGSEEQKEHRMKQKLPKTIKSDAPTVIENWFGELSPILRQVEPSFKRILVLRDKFSSLFNFFIPYEITGY